MGPRPGIPTSFPFSRIGLKFSFPQPFPFDLRLKSQILGQGPKMKRKAVLNPDQRLSA